MPIDAICSGGTFADKIGVALVRADDDRARLRDREIAAGHAGRLLAHEVRPRMHALAFGEVVDVAVVRIGADGSAEHLGDVGAQLVDRRHDHVARVLVVELLDALAEIGLHHRRCRAVPRILAHLAFVGEHRLALDERASCRART